MANGFTKLHSGILGSTIWRESPGVKVVWITLLAMADQDGIVEATLPGLAAFSNVGLEETEAAIEKFLSPDKYSRTPDCEGRRIEVIDGGWRLLNYDKYREKLSKEELKEKARLRQQRHRDRAACHEKRDAGVTERDDRGKSRMSLQAEADCRGQNAEAIKPKTLAHSTNELGGGISPDRGLDAENDPPERPSKNAPNDKRASTAKSSMLALAIYNRYPRRVAKAQALKAICKAIVLVAKAGATDTHPDFKGDEEAAAQWLGSRIDQYGNSPQARQQDKSKIPYPATWFNAGRYDDDEAEWTHVGLSKGGAARVFEQIGGNAESHSGFEDVLSRPDPAWVEAASR
jgi:hypothetical protein